MRTVQAARIRKTLEFLKDRQGYADRLVKELVNLETRALKKGHTPVARLNGTSDIPWEKYIPMEAFSNTKFYDYTKNDTRMWQYLDGELPENYYLTYSCHESTTVDDVFWLMYEGGSVAVVFRNTIPNKFQGIDVISGMEHDFRFRDKKGCIIGLLARGRAKKDSTGFVVD
jgi:hypothetical protein